MKQEKIVICGGHLSPALAVIEELDQRKIYKIYYIGRKNSLEGDTSLSLEYKVINKLNIPFYSLYCGRLQRSFTLYTLPSLAKFPIALLQSFIILSKIRPKSVISFGGYVALPVCLVAYMLRIPIIIHEQTHILGLTNRVISHFAKVVCLSWKNTEHIPRGVKTVLTGNPIRNSLLHPTGDNLIKFGDEHLPLLYITGGNSGSSFINKIVGENISFLSSHFRIIHQCGSADGERDFQFLTKIKNSLPDQLKNNYYIIGNINPEDIGNIYHKTRLVIGRAGANTVVELAIAGIPAILIPLPWSADDEQIYNAKILKDIGLAEVLRQEEVTAGSFVSAVNSMMQNLPSYKANAEKGKKILRLDASRHIAELIDSVLGRTPK